MEEKIEKLKKILAYSSADVSDVEVLELYLSNALNYCVNYLRSHGVCSQINSDELDDIIVLYAANLAYLAILSYNDEDSSKSQQSAFRREAIMQLNEYIDSKGECVEGGALISQASTPQLKDVIGKGWY
jgi:hypothetical protein